MLETASCSTDVLAGIGVVTIHPHCEGVGLMDADRLLLALDKWQTLMATTYLAPCTNVPAHMCACTNPPLALFGARPFSPCAPPCPKLYTKYGLRCRGWDALAHALPHPLPTLLRPPPPAPLSPHSPPPIPLPLLKRSCTPTRGVCGAGAC